MSDLIFNLRISRFHLQVDENFRPRIVYNSFHRWFRSPYGFIKLYNFGEHTV